ncbi:MAG: tryptophan synthase subunit alpha [Persicimonas sp.]
MHQRLENTCKRASSGDQKLLMTALVAGDPYLEATLEYMRVLADNGADLIELLFPFSEPTYHGAVIQRASARAIREEVTWEELIELGREFRQTHQTPVFFSSYYNRILARGVDDFVDFVDEADFDGAMVTDLPFEEGDRLRSRLAERDLILPSAVAPTTTTERFRRIESGSEGFLIWTGHSGGDPTISSEQFADRMREFHRLSDLPILASMKISTGQDAEKVVRDCDGALVGSAVVWLIEGRGPDVEESLAQFVSELRDGVDGTLPAPDSEQE